MPAHADLSDEEFLATFERAAFGPHEFPHRAHLRMAFLYVNALGVDAATGRAVAGLRRLAAAHGHAGRYHDTITRAWVRVVALAVSHHHPGCSFDDLLAAHPALLDKHLLLRHWSRDALFSPEARATWVAPDLHPIPAAA